MKAVKNESLGPRKRLPRSLKQSGRLNTGARLVQVCFTVIKGNDFLNFVMWPLIRGWPLNRGSLSKRFTVVWCWVFFVNVATDHRTGHAHHGRHAGVAPAEEERSVRHNRVERERDWGQEDLAGVAERSQRNKSKRDKHVRLNSRPVNRHEPRSDRL